MKSLLNAFMLSILFTLTSCAHYGHGGCCKSKCDDSKEQCAMKKEQCQMKKEQCPMKKDEKTEEASPAKK